LLAHFSFSVEEKGKLPNPVAVQMLLDVLGFDLDKCDGNWHCQFPRALTPCGQCKACDGSGKCNVPPEDDATCGVNGVIDCSGLNTSCMQYRDLTVKRCAGLGMCKEKNSAACTDVTMTCTPDGASGDAAGGDGPAPTKGGGGGCCSVAASPHSAGELLLELVVVAGVAGVARRRRRRG